MADDDKKTGFSSKAEEVAKPSEPNKDDVKKSEKKDDETPSPTQEELDEIRNRALSSVPAKSYKTR